MDPGFGSLDFLGRVPLCEASTPRLAAMLSSRLLSRHGALYVSRPGLQCTALRVRNNTIWGSLNATRCASTLQSTGEEKTGHISAGANEGIFFLDSMSIATLLWNEVNEF